MKFDELFEQRSLVASKLKDCIRDNGILRLLLRQRPILYYQHLISC